MYIFGILQWILSPELTLCFTARNINQRGSRVAAGDDLINQLINRYFQRHTVTKPAGILRLCVLSVGIAHLSHGDEWRASGGVEL